MLYKDIQKISDHLTLEILNVIHIELKRRLKYLINISLAVFIIHLEAIKVTHH